MMINTKSLEALSSARFGEQNWVRPLYESYNFARIPATARSILLGELSNDALPLDTLGGELPKAQKVITIFIDALGWQHIEPRLKKDPLLKQAQKHGVISKLTSQFPSITPAHVTTINTGLPCAQHGVFTGAYYEPKLDGLLGVFGFNELGERYKDSLWERKIDPKQIYWPTTIYEDFQQKYEIPSWSFAAHKEIYGAYSSTMRAGATPVEYPNSLINKGLEKLKESVESNTGKGYYHFYFSELDGISHMEGPWSFITQGLVDDILHNLHESLSQTKLDDTAVMIFADHGHMEGGMRSQMSSLHDSAPEVLRMFPKSGSGLPITPGGSKRENYVYLEPKHFQEGLEIMQKSFEHKALVEPSQKLLDEGYFGPNPSSKLLGRLNGKYPSVTILPYYSRYICWDSLQNYGNGADLMKIKKGHHGGLSANEMEIPFIYLPPGSI